MMKVLYGHFKICELCFQKSDIKKLIEASRLFKNQNLPIMF